MSDNGKLIIFSAPSGAGKTTIVRHLLERIPSLAFSVSCTTRGMRPNEIHGKDYFFLNVSEFREKIDRNEFAEWEEVYENQFYGTLNSEINRLWAEGKQVLFDIDVQGGINLKKKFGDNALSVFVRPPGIEELEKRLRLRNTESEEKLKIRIQKAAHEMTFAPEFDIILVNNNLETAQEEAFTLVTDFIKDE